MAATDLVTIDQVKTWLSSSPVSADDTLLKTLISPASQIILTNLQRGTVLSKSYTDVVNGYGQSVQMLKNWPVTSVEGITLNANTIAPSLSTSNPNNGFVLAPWDGELPGGPQVVSLRGQSFCQGVSNAAITYTAGYRVSDEQQTIPATPFKITVDQLNGAWARDEGVVSSTGTVFVKVSSSPAAGQYTVSAGGVYLFNSADSATQVLISYSYVPSPLGLAAAMMVGELYRYRDRQGKKSITAPGPQTMAFDNAIMTDAIKMMISQFCNVVPII